MYNTILVPLDGSDLAERALIPARAVAARNHSELLLLHVPLPEEIMTTVPIGHDMPIRAMSLEGPHKKGEAYLEEITARIKEEDPDSPYTVSAKMIDGDPASVIVDTATAQKVDLIAMSTHGHTGLRRWLYGSVTEKVLRGATCDMLIVRPPKESLKETDKTKQSHQR